ncbi:OmpA family protein [Caballeronia sp. LjRoot31]|uniref:OmpA family protein n=1 Tax=Caballeronia sp. LjRoot31 TaxID=3342324 RepID=UPI003ECF91FB
MESLGNNPSWTRSLAALACVAIVLGPSLSRAAATTLIIQPTQAPSTSPQITASAAHAVTATLSADAMFAFGSSKLSPAGRESLANLFDSLGGTNQISRLSVVGHSDPIGGATYNERLSDQRANSVKAFFIEQGVQAASIDASGVGDTNPVTKNCPRLQNAEAIKCHGPDRRVELRAIVQASTPTKAAPSTDAGFIDLRAQPNPPVTGDTAGIQIAAKEALALTIEPSAAPAMHSVPTAVPAIALTQQAQALASRSSTSKPVAASTQSTNIAPLAQLDEARSSSSESDPVVAPVIVPDKLQRFALKSGLPLEDQIVADGAKAGWTVLWNIPGNWTAPNDASFSGDFEHAAIQFFDQMAENGADIWVDVWEGNHTIIVTPTGAQGAEQ